MMRAKLFGYIDGPDSLMRRYPLSNTSLAARYARAVSAYRHTDLRGALAQIDSLTQAQPNNPYFLELKGQALVDSGRAREAIAPLRHAISLAPDPTLIHVLLGQALLGANDPALVEEAIANLKRRSPTIWRSPTPTTTSPLHMDARAISPMPISPPPRRRSTAAICRPPGNWRLAQRGVLP